MKSKKINPMALHMVVDMFVNLCHERSVQAGWYSNKKGKRKPANVGEKIALIHSEISEAMEGYRKGINDDHLPNHSMVMVEFADALIRIADLAGYLNEMGNRDSLGRCVIEKLEYNLHRADHKPEVRGKEGGKKF